MPRTTESGYRVEPFRGFPSWSLREVARYRDLVELLVQKDLEVKYQNLKLGPLWLVLQPLLTAAVLFVTFGRLVRPGVRGASSFLFFMSGVLLWGLFARCVTQASRVFSGNIQFFSKVYAPRIVVPIASALFVLTEFAAQWAVFGAVWLWGLASGGIHAAGFDARPLLLAVLAILQVTAAGWGVGLWIASVSVKVEDLQYGVPFGLQIGMFLSAVFYPISSVPEAYRSLFLLNPAAFAMDLFRVSAFGGALIAPAFIGVSWIETAVIFISGVLAFGYAEHAFEEYLE